MDVALVATSDNPEILWNCFRLGNLMLEQMDEVTIFLDGPSVNFATMSSDKYPILPEAKLFTLSEGTLQA
jgi:uncharacterized protein involved in oxidation of intracellular sulfur